MSAEHPAAKPSFDEFGFRPADTPCECGFEESAATRSDQPPPPRPEDRRPRPKASAAQMGDEACTRCGATPETGQGEDCPECQGIVGPLRLSYGGIFPDVEERYKKLRGETT